MSGDDRGENLTGLLILVACVFVVGAFAIGLCNPLFLSGTNEQSGTDALTLFGTVEVGDYWNPTGGFTTNWTDVSDNPLDYPNWIQYPNAYDYDDYWAVSMLNVRNNTQYTTVFPSEYQKYYDMLIFKDAWANIYAIGYSQIENATNYDGGTVYAIIYSSDLSIMNSTTAVLIEFEDDATEVDVNEALYETNIFTVSIVYVVSYSGSVGELQWYDVAWRIATFQYVATGTVFDFIFSAIFDMVLVSTTILIFSRILHGGG